MFTDVAGFTGISEELGDRVVPVLAEYLEAVSTAVLNRSGTIGRRTGLLPASATSAASP